MKNQSNTLKYERETVLWFKLVSSTLLFVQTVTVELVDLAFKKLNELVNFF